MADLLERFITSFRKAVDAEMAAMRERLGPFEVGLAGGRRADGAERDSAYLSVFDVLTPNDKLVLHGECTFVGDGVETLVTVTALDDRTVTLEAEIALPNAAEARLVIYPWFLYERLQESLDGLRQTDRHTIESALRLFGKVRARGPAPRTVGSETAAELNDAQRRAVDLCAASDLAFVWGPPGTGKTTTLGHIVLALLGQGRRLRVTSTTNAAVDQALAKLAALPAGRAALDRGAVVRVGFTEAPTFGASLRDVARRRDERTRKRLERLEGRRPRYAQQAEAAASLVERLDSAAGPRQLSLFGATSVDTLTLRDLRTVFGDGLARTLAGRPDDEQRRALERRRHRLEGALELSLESMAVARRALRNQERAALAEARVVLATMTNMYVNRLLRDERFDVVIVEEAGMAVLPTLFYCATLARSATIMVGDPRQLPPIVQSSADYVRKAMGRSIFDVTVPDPHGSDLVVMLDRQYRMHPTIGGLVSDLFYDGRLRSVDVAVDDDERTAIVAAPPFPGEPLAVVDMAGRGVCATLAGAWSRFNEASAALTVDVARRAVDGGVASVAIIAPYAEHVRCVGRLLRERVPLAVRRCVECRTVHRFQGNERDMVIFDAVDAEPLKPGVLLTDGSAANLINVSISRARGKLVIVADRHYFERRTRDSVVERLLRQAAKRGVVVTPDEL